LQASLSNLTQKITTSMLLVHRGNHMEAPYCN